MSLDDLGRSTDGLPGAHEGPGDHFDATVLVTSVLGFTERCEGMEPAEVATWSNGFFHQLTEAVLKHGGVPVKYMGDGFLSYFAGGDHQWRAVLSSLTARDSIADRVIFGLAAGPIHLASIGHSSYARPDILGATVNRAFRINGWAAGNAKTRIAMATPNIEDVARRCQVGDAVAVSLKGIADPVRIFEIGDRLP
jgi:class 3 adenylate cyclase